jgi:hypothetical protein
MTIFGLLMWDVMFSDIKDVFQSKFQACDLWTMFLLFLRRITIFPAKSWETHFVA